MATKYISGECSECESLFEVEYMEEMVSQDVPQYCPFCGGEITDVTEEFVEEDESGYDDEDYDDKEW